MQEIAPFYVFFCNNFQGKYAPDRRPPPYHEPLHQVRLPRVTPPPQFAGMQPTGLKCKLFWH